MNSRDFKFRAWDNLNKKWLLGYDLPNLGGFSLTGEVILFGEWGNVFDKFLFAREGRKFEDLIIEQSIEKIDLHKKLIYEGDVVKCQHTEGLSWQQNYTDIGVVVYGDQGAYVIKCLKKGCENAKDHSKRYFYLSFSPKRTFEVLGNIHENPELWQVKD